WCSMRARALPDDEAVAARLSGLARRLSPDLPRTLPDAVPGRDFDWSRFPMPDWATSQPDAVVAASHLTPANIRFVDQARELGIDFQFVNDDDNPLGKRIFQISGGGVAALDYEGDGWTDLYFAQGGSWPVVPGTGPRDVLFRNRSGQRF